MAFTSESATVIIAILLFLFCIYKKDIQVSKEEKAKIKQQNQIVKKIKRTQRKKKFRKSNTYKMFNQKRKHKKVDRTNEYIDAIWDEIK